MPASLPQYDKDRIKGLAQGRWISILEQLGGLSSSILNGTHHPCPKCGGTDRFRAVEIDAGALFCGQCFSSNNGDGFDALQWLNGWSFGESIRQVAQYLNVSPDHSGNGQVAHTTTAAVPPREGVAVAQSNGHKPKDPAKGLAFLDWFEPKAALWCRAKPGVTTRAALTAGARLARYRNEFSVVCFPIWGESGPAEDPKGFVLLEQSGGTIPHKSPGAEVQHLKVKVTAGSGLINEHANRILHNPELRKHVTTIWRAEGVSDCIALQSLIPADLINTHLVISHSAGCAKPTQWMLKLFASCEALQAFYVIGDRDNPGVKAAAIWSRQIASLTKATVRNIELPFDLVEDHGNDLRDWINTSPNGQPRTYHDALSLAEKSPLVVPTEQSQDPANDSLIYEVDDPNRLARGFMKHNSTPKGEQKLVLWNSEWFKYEFDSYVAVDLPEIKADLVRFIQREFEADAEKQLFEYRTNPPAEDEDNGPPTVRKVKRGLVDDAMQHVGALAEISPRIPQPSWLRNKPEGFDSRQTIVTKSGVINLRKLTAGEPDYLVPPTPDYFSTSCIPLEFTNALPQPTEWLRFLNDIWHDDPESIECLQEFMGLYLVPDTTFQKILLIVGPKRSGKGTIARIIRAMLGESSVAGPTLAGLATNFGLWPLVGKQAAIIADARLSNQSDTAIITERLLSISGEDGMTIDRKNLSPITVTFPTRFILMTNELPRLADDSNALSGRFIILRMVNSFYGQEDRTLTDRLMKELPSILAWAIAGWKRLVDRGYFTVPETSIDLVNQLEDAASPISAFLRDKCELGTGEDFEEDKADVFGAWKVWCESENRAHPGTSAAFGVKLRAAAPGVSDLRPRVDGKRVNRYSGIRLRQTEMTDEEVRSLF